MASSVQSRQRHADRRLSRNVEDSPSTGFQYPKCTISDGSRGILLWSAVDTNKLISDLVSCAGMSVTRGTKIINRARTIRSAVATKV